MQAPSPGIKFPTILAGGLAILITLTAQQAAAFDCTTATSGRPPQQAADKLLAQSFDTEKLACGVSILTTIADQNADSYTAQIAALQANARNIYFLDRIVLYELGYLIAWYVTEVPEETKTNASMIALLRAQQEQMRLLDRARENGFETTELDYYQALSIGPKAKALALLDGVVDADPDSLKGAGHALLSETYYTLPDIAGGDLDQAIKMMQAARDRQPGNPRYLRLLAGYLLDAAHTDKALSALQQLLVMNVDTAGLQLMADQLRVAPDLAQRIGDAELAQKLSARHKDTLAEHPYLQQRKVVSAMGHFGDRNPMVEE